MHRADWPSPTFPYTTRIMSEGHRLYLDPRNTTVDTTRMISAAIGRTHKPMSNINPSFLILTFFDNENAAVDTHDLYLRPGLDLFAVLRHGLELPEAALYRDL